MAQASAITIRDLTRCSGCNRWIANPWAHLRCLPPLLNDEEPPDAKNCKRWPKRKLMHVDVRERSCVLYLSCGHQQTRTKATLRYMPLEVHCEMCGNDQRTEATATTTEGEPA